MGGRQRQDSLVVNGRKHARVSMRGYALRNGNAELLLAYS
jgi:hypothetical protein